MRLTRARARDLLLVLAAGVSVAGYMQLVNYLDTQTAYRHAKAAQEAPSPQPMRTAIGFDGGD